ncbi:hypothetical protein CRENBAI_002925 [Crenichthys baileyi]|uniref:Uncharacterized protein n=1 Tax=Crenichthys baileyi TaxID=28760 RepID=A0AAV9RND2_9TELE
MPVSWPIVFIFPLVFIDDCKLNTDMRSGDITGPWQRFVWAVAEVCPVTAGLPVQIPALSVSVVVYLGKTLHLLCLLMVVRGIGGACVWQPHFCQSAPGHLWLQCSSPLSLGYLALCPVPSTERAEGQYGLNLSRLRRVLTLLLTSMELPEHRRNVDHGVWNSRHGAFPEYDDIHSAFLKHSRLSIWLLSPEEKAMHYGR